MPHIDSQDIGDTVLGPIKYGTLAIIPIQVTFGASGAVSAVEAFGYDVDFALDTTGDYDVTFPSGQVVQVLGCELEQEDDAPGNTWQEAGWIDFVPAGTGKVLTGNEDNTSGIWTQADPVSGTKLHLTLLVGSF